jgi:hypothetical protein
MTTPAGSKDVRRGDANALNKAMSNYRDLFVTTSAGSEDDHDGNNALKEAMGNDSDLCVARQSIRQESIQEMGVEVLDLFDEEARFVEQSWASGSSALDIWDGKGSIDSDPNNDVKPNRTLE